MSQTIPFSLHARLQRLIAPAIAALILVAPVGCRSLFTEERGLHVSQERLRRIDAMHLADRAAADPVSIDDASESISESIVERDKPPATATLSLADVRAATLSNNLDLEVELINPSISQSSLDAEEAKFEATFRAAATRASTDTPTALSTESSQADFEQYSLGIDIPLRTGGTATINFPVSTSKVANDFVTLNPSFSADAELRLSQPLLRNGGIQVNTHSIRVARHQRQITDVRTKLEAIRILANADRAYWTLYAVQRELEVRYQQYELAMEQLDRARRREEAGEGLQIDIIRAESGLAERLEAIIISKTAVRRAERDLKRIMNRDDIPIASPTALVLTTESEPVGLRLDADVLSDYAIDNRMEMLEKELELAIDASSIDFERNQALPLFTLDYRYNINGLGSTYNNALDQIVDHSFEDWSVTLRAEVPIGNEAAEARVHRAILTRLQRLSSRDLRVLAIRQEVYDAVDQLEQSWQRVVAARLSKALAQRTYEAEQRQFIEGERTSTDVLDAATNWADEESREIRAITDYHIAAIDIAFATGTLLGSNQVRWDPIDFAE